MADMNYPEFYNLKFNKGRFFSVDELKERERVCVIGYYLKNNLFADQNPIDKMVIIGEYDYKVIGVIKNLQMSIRLIAPLTSIDKDKLGSLSTIFLLKFRSKTDLQIAIEKVKRFFDSKNLNIHWEWAFESLKEDLKEGAKIYLLLMLVSFALTIFVILNIGNIVYILADLEKKYNGIKYAIGVSSRDIFIERLASLIFVSLCAFITIVIILLCIVYAIPQISLTMFIRNWIVFLTPSFLAVILLSVTEGFLLMKNILGQNAINLLKD
ncbi:MAG: ABC transporter permease [Halanaerobiales bacterium]|nr:ABC transporter permease [Halanaerobiales bacterium]